MDDPFGNFKRDPPSRASIGVADFRNAINDPSKMKGARSYLDAANTPAKQPARSSSRGSSSPTWGDFTDAVNDGPTMQGARDAYAAKPSPPKRTPIWAKTTFSSRELEDQTRGTNTNASSSRIAISEGGRDANTKYAGRSINNSHR